MGKSRTALVLCVASWMTVAGAGSSWGQEARITAGASVWFPSWSIQVGDNELDSRYGAVPEAALDLRWKNFFSGIRFGVTRISFGDTRVCASRQLGCEFVTDMAGDMMQLEAVAGYAPVRWAAPYIGLLHQNQEIQYTIRSRDVTVRQNLTSGTAGILLRSPVRGKGDLLYGKAAFVGLEMQDTVGGIFEVGAAYPFSRVPVVVSMALRYQIFNYKENDFDIQEINETRTSDRWVGLSAGVSYGF